jgi:hypothetical protein
MPGGLLNIVSEGQGNIILNGNPQKTFFNSTYKTYSNFGMQKFRIDFDGQRTLRMSESSTFRFYIPRYAELLMDTYMVIDLPTIWSPIVPPQDCSGVWQPYDFKWIENLGTQMIESVELSVGGQVLQKMSGQYLYNLVERDWSAEKKQLYYQMTGNTPDLNDPSNADGRNGQYPSAYYTTSTLGPEPSIRGRQLFVPINAWFTLSSKQAFPLVSTQYNQLVIDITLRPVADLFVVRDLDDPDGNYIRPNLNDPRYSFYKFLQPPPSIELHADDYSDRRTNWNAAVHLNATYVYLSQEEVRRFASLPQKYLIKEVYEYNFNNTTGTGKVDLDSLSVVADWMWYFQRSDAKLRNQWSNYTNWAYDGVMPSPLRLANNSDPALTSLTCGPVTSYTPAVNPLTDSSSNLYITGDYSPDNQQRILETWGIVMDGKYRENPFPAGVFDYVEKYVRTGGYAKPGLYCYNFNLNTSPFDLQPSGGMNVSKFRNIQFEYKTYYPPMDPSAQFYTVCDPETGVPIAVNKPTWRVYDYTYDLHVMEERYNVVLFESGNAGLMFAR